MTELRERPDPIAAGWDDIPAGCRLAVVPAGPRWRVVTRPSRCRHRMLSLAAPRHCERPAAAELLRGVSRLTWWSYCEKHMSGKWIEDGQVVGYVLRAEGEDD